jgi:uncharacterized membrane protein YkoI
MKSPSIITSLAALTLFTGLGITSAFAGEQSQKEQAELTNQAKISLKEAAQSALQKVPAGILKEAGEIEKEKGLLVWSFDITTPNSQEITEVWVDALTGKVVRVEQENAKAQAAEAAADAKASH